MTLWEVILRLFAATLIGGAIGLNRDLHGKATGVRTLGLVSLGSALIIMGVIDLPAPANPDMNPLSRVIQGVLTGIGFLGAGVILHEGVGERGIHGLTTAAVTWLTACIGLICGIGNWKLLLVGLTLLSLLLVLGRKIEQRFHPGAEG